MKRKPKSELKKLVAECHALWSRAVKLRDNNQCRVIGCGSDSGLQSHHVFADRMHGSTRYMLSNGIALCFFHHYPMGHSNPCVMRENIVKAIGEDAYKALEKYAYPNKPVKYKVQDLQEIKSQLRGLLLDFDDIP
jgi:hypothetical protein